MHSRTLVLGVVAVFGLASCGAYWLIFIHPKASFIRQWSDTFNRIDSLEAAKELKESSSATILRIFPSGEWMIASCEHSCCSGAGFDATVIRDSTGAIHTNTTYTFCGIEGLDRELGDKTIPAESLAEFYTRLSSQKLHMTKLK